MRITRITERRVRNLGNYETRTVEWEAQLAEGDDPAEAQQEVRRRVDAMLFYTPMLAPEPVPGDEADEYDLSGLPELGGDDGDE